MKKVDSGEYFNSKQDNIFSEFKSFPAEDYYTSELSKLPKETDTFDESFNNQGVNSSKTETEGQTDFDKLKKEYDRLNSSDTTDTSNSATPSNSSAGSDTSSASTSSQAASTSSSAAQASSVAGGAAAGAGATAVAAVVIVSAAISGGFIANFENYVGNNVGADYVSITVDMDEVLSQADKTYALSADNFFIEFTQGNSLQKIAIVEGKHSYLVTGLLPEKTYYYSITCNNASFGSNSSCYSGNITTKSAGKPECVLDDFNNYISYDEATQTASLYYSLYLSDCEKKLSNTTLYICSSEQTDFSNVKQIIYSDNRLDENNFFKGSADGITYDELYVYVVGQAASEAQTETTCLFSQKIEVGLPDGWAQDLSPAFAVDEGVEELTCQPDSIYISGALSNLNENYTYFAFITQYLEGGTALIERQEVGLITDPENMTYSLNGEAYYGVKKFKYVIFALDGEGNEVTVYDSGERLFTASQDYGASYTKVEPADAAIEYGASGVTITVDPEFTSQYGNYGYKLVVTNSAGEVFGEYQGTGVAVIEIANYVGLDQINFTYYDIGTFINGEIEFDSHATTGIAGKAYFIVDESAEGLTCQPDGIYISGKLNNLNGNYAYFAYIAQYSEDGAALVERQEADFTLDTENMTYNLAGGAYYEVNKFKYVIFALDGEGNEVTVYDSGEKSFTASQDYGATYTKVEPADAAIEYGASGVTITVDPEFTSQYGNYGYKLVVTNSAGEVYGEYHGTGVAVIDITDVTRLDEINFTYYDLGTFIDGEHEYGSHATEGVAFCVPAVSFGTEVGFDGQYFTLSYTSDMVYDYSAATMDIEVRDSDGTAYSKRIESVSEKGTVILDNIEGEIGDVTVTATLNFKDNQSDGREHSLTLAQAEYALNYSFEVSKVAADVSGFSSETMSVKLNFDYTMPYGYMVKITDDANAIDLTLPLAEVAEGYSINDLDMDIDYNLTIQATDADGNNWGEAKTINISKSAAEAEYSSIEFSMSSPNPGDAVVTYNEDGTINVYRQMIPDAYGRDTVSDDERVYYDAHLYAGYYDADYNFIETHSYEVIGRGKYAVIENIAKENYNFTYYKMFDYNGVSYVMYGEMPSGSVETIYDCGVAAAIVADGQTTVNVNLSKYGKIANKIIVNGVEYEYDYYSDESQTDLTLTIDGEVDVSEVTIFFTSQGYNYDAYGASGEITMKGSKYGEYTITVTPVEA